jgi:hypothetical protein
MLALEPFWMSMATIRPNNIRIEAKLIIPLRGIKVITKESEL